MIKLFLAEETIENFIDYSQFSKKKASSVKKQTAGKKVQLDILYEDEAAVFINKPVGMLSQKASPTDTSLVEYFIDYLLENGKSRKKNCIHFIRLSATVWTEIQAESWQQEKHCRHYRD